MLLTVLAFVVTLGVLVTVHEWGHYWVARRCGVKVLTFSIGFGKPLLRWQRGDERWQLAAIPLGGFVRMLDEREAPALPHEVSQAFNRQHPFKKILIVVAGPLANLVLALLLYAGLYVHGVDAIRPIAGQVTPASIADRAGFRPGDEIVSVNGRPVASWDEAFVGLLDAAGDAAPVRVGVRSADAQTTVRSLPLDQLGRAVYEPRLLIRLGFTPYPLTTTIERVEAGSAAANAGLMAGDVITSLNGAPLEQWADLQAVLQQRAQALTLGVRRGEVVRQISVVPTSVEVSGRKIGRLGLEPAVDERLWQQYQVQLKYPPLAALSAASEKIAIQTKLTLAMFGRMIVGKASLDQVSGPLTIATYAGESARLGLSNFIEYLALISLSLAVLNLLPVPLLDGGHLLYHVVELLTGRPVSPQVEAIGQRVGLTLLLALMALALFNDIHRLFLG
ncbi:RIP metalloprotease RseP [Jeongeupia naejangsanensis]|uniref:Zinc metalloprotease n=1 Tax=Jeongeupia naejangsanensis TaxID=613195 RepID=A0ABS2BG75_9NEIS|nr:RIP metalloprotease RseP [Jeongeupia naejangsanensis]MBM3114460.1 RIP metalloprotease RseP [Jeongeupia naejangsanensis]